jgi:hypothetical protein
MPRDIFPTEDNMETRFNQYSIIYLALSLFALLMAVYSLTYSGTFISDDEHILTSRTLSLAFDGYMNDSRVMGNGRVFLYANSTPTYASQGLNVEPGQAVVGSLFARLATLLGTGKVQTVFLLNIWVTAMTAVVLFVSVLILGYPRSTAFLSALLFGIGTIVWPYTQTYYRDVLAMLFVTITWACAFFLVSNEREEHKSKKEIVLSWFFLFISLLAGILTKNTVLLVIPVLVIYSVANVIKANPPLELGIFLRKSWKRLIFVLAGVVLLIVAWIKLLSPIGLLARFSLTYYVSLLSKFITTPHPDFWEAIFGPLLSPGKSIFLYSPILLLSIVGLFKRWRLAWPGWIFLLLLIFGQALFYDGDWWGHINWGLRYLLPAFPLLMIAVTPVIEWLLKVRKRHLLLICLGIFSVMIQLLGVLVPTQKYFADLYDSSSSISEAMAIWNPKFSPIRWNFHWIATGEPLNTAASRVGGTAIPLILVAFLLIGIIVLGLTRINWYGLPILALSISIGISIMVLFIYKDDPAYYNMRQDLEGTKDYIVRCALPDDEIFLKSYGTPAWYYWMNWADQSLRWTSMPYYYPSPDLLDGYYSTGNPEIAMDEITLTLLQDISTTRQRIWFVLPADSPGADLNIEIDWLKTRSISMDVWGFPEGNIETKLFLFTFSPFQSTP